MAAAVHRFSVTGLTRNDWFIAIARAVERGPCTEDGQVNRAKPSVLTQGVPEIHDVERAVAAFRNERPAI